MSNLSIQTISPQEWPMILQQAEMLVTTGFLPQAINTPQKAVAIMLKGRELGIAPMQALGNIAVIQGKPVANAELMLALIFREHGDRAMDFIESTNERCTIRYQRRNAREPREYTFTMDDAKKAGVANSPTWQKYPAAMLRARCISAVARMAFPDAVMGLYSPDEMGASVDEETGEILTPATTTPPIYQVVSTTTTELPPPAPIKPAATVTVAQLKEIRRLIPLMEGTESALCEQLKVGALEELPEVRAGKVIARMQELLSAQTDVAEPEPTPAPAPPVNQKHVAAVPDAHRVVLGDGYAKPAWAEDEGSHTPRFDGATEKQVKAIYAIGRGVKRLSESQVEDRCAEIFGVRPNELTKAEASQFLDMLKGEGGN